MSRNSSLYAAFVCVLCCSGAVALQPTVRAGSISLNSGIKPTAGAITSTTSATTTTNNDSSRGSALSKFSPAVVPVSRPNNNNNNQASSSTLDELRQQIADLRAAQLDLERNQLTSSQVETAIENTVKGLDLTTTNTDLKNTLLDLQQQSTSLQTSVTALQNQADNFDDNIETTLDNRLKVRGLISSNNTIPFALKSEISPVALANTIVADQNATNTLANNIKPKESEIKEIIRDELVDQEILKNNGELNVEKKGEVQVTEATVTNALRNSDDFKQMVLTEIADNGGYVTTTALDNKKFLSTDSVAFANLATKDDVTPAAIAASIADSESAKQVLSGKIGPDESSVKGLITGELQRLQIVDGANTLKVATTAQIDPVSIATSIADNETAKAKLSGKIGPDESSVKGLIFDELKKRDIVDASDNLKLATASDVSVESLTDKLDDIFAGKNEVPTIDEKTVSAALANSTTLDDTIIRNLKNKRLLKDSGDLNVATNDSVSTLSSRVAVLDGDINDDGSLLKRIATDETLRNALKGEDGKDGSGFTFKGNIASYSELSSKTKAQGDAWYNEDDTLLYICSCDTNGANCAYPANGKGVPFRGEKGDKGDPGASADSVWKTYCTATNDKEPTKTNLDAIIRPLYGNDKTCDNFTKDEYTSLLGVARSYCVSIAQDAKLNPAEFMASDNARNLQRVFGANILESLTNYGVGATAYIYNRNMKVVDLCVQSYKDIINPETTWYSYCNEGTNLTSIIQPLYGASTVPDCKSFTQEQYNALMDGAKAYCMLVAKNAKENSNYLVATKGIGKTLEDVFGSGTVSNLKNNGLSASVSINGQSEKFVFACAKKYDEIMKPKSAWYSYCTEGTNLTSIIQPLYGASTVKTCDDFTQEQYNAIIGGPKAYCLMVAKNVDSSTLNVKNNLKRLFGDTIVSTLSSQKVATKVTLNNQTISFVDACAQKYEEIMAGKSGEGYLYRGTIDNYSELSGKSCDAEHEADAYYNLEVGDALLYICACNDDKTSCSFPAKGKGVNFKGEPGENGKPASQIYCEAHAVNYPSDVTNLTLIQKLYPNKGISSCDPSVFTQDLYAAIIGGANAYCTSLNATFNTGVSLNEGIGLKFARLYAAKKNVSLTSAKSALQVLQNKNAKERMNDSDFSILDECIANYNSIMSGDDAEDPWYTYCTATNEKDNTKTNLQAIITPLYGHTTCDAFTKDEYAALMDGATAYCTLIAQEAKMNASTFAATDKAKNLKRVLGETALTNLISSGVGATITKGGQTVKVVNECVQKYNDIMNPETTWHAYCVAQNVKDSSKTNLEAVIKPLYGTGKTCDNFTSEEYTALMDGAKAYCTFIAQDAKLNPTEFIKTDKAKNLKRVLGETALTSLTTNGVGATMTLGGQTVKVVDACVQKYNDIMNPETAWHAYCTATNEKDNTQTNLTAIIQPLYGTGKTCDNFTSEEYNALLNGAKAYCVLVAQQLQSQTLDAFKATDIGKRLTKTLGATAISDLKTTGLGATMTLNSRTVKVVDACVEKYNEIMNPETAWHAYCVETDANSVSNLDKIIKPLYGNNKTCDNFTSDEYNAIMGGAKAYCLSLAKDPSVLGDLTSGIGKKLKSALGDKVSDFKSASTVQARISMTGFQKASSSSMKFTDACEEKYNEIMSGADGESAWHAYCVATNEKDSTKTNLTAIIQPLYGNSKTCDNFTSDEYNAIMGGASAYCLLLAQDLSANKLDITSGIGAKLSTNLTADSGQQTISALKGKSLTTVLNNKFNGNKTFVKACEAKYNEIMAGDDGKDGEDAATIWCKAHTLNANDTRLTTTSATVKKMSAAKLVTAFKAAGNSDTKLSKAQDASTGAVNGYFTDLQTCINAVNADPTLMGGESAAETQYNEDVKKEKTENGTTFTLGTSTVTTFENKKNTFGSKMVTTDNIGSKLSGTGVMMASDVNDANSTTGQAIRNANISSMADLGIVTVSGTGSNQTITSNVPTSSTIETMVNNKVNNNSTISGLSTRMTNIEKNAVTSSTVESMVNNKISNNSTISGLSTRMTNVENNAVTKNNLATELTSNTAQTALANAGFATKSNITKDVKNDVFTLSDFSQLLSSGGLEVDNKGKLKLASTSTNAAAANINAKLTAAKANDASIQTTGLTATSNITNAIASVAASAAGEEINSSEVCYKHEWMYWSNAEKCEKCPDGTYFNEDSMSNNSLPRCTCKDETMTFSNDGSCVKGNMGSEQCSGANGAGLYYSSKSKTCEKCPDGTYFNEESMSNTSLPRCTCKDKSMTFDATSGACTAAGSCAATKTVANPKEDGKCQECPKEFPFLQETGSCACPEGTAFNAYRWACADCGAAGAEYNPETQSCVCPAGSTLNQEQWKCTK